MVPFVVFDDRLKNSDRVYYRGHRVGVSGVIYKRLKRNERLTEILLLDINKFKTSSVSPYAYMNCFQKTKRNSLSYLRLSLLPPKKFEESRSRKPHILRYTNLQRLWYTLEL